MRIEDLDALGEVSTRAIVVNVRTDLATTLAVASLQRHASPARVLVVDLAPTDVGRAFLDRLAAMWDFDVFESHERPHGEVLDKVVPRANAEAVLLLDSDAELLDPGLFAQLRSAIADPEVYAAGFEQASVPVPPDYPWRATRVARRPWPVCLMLDTDAVRTARIHGASFYPSDDGTTFFDTGALLCRWLEQRGWRFERFGTASPRPKQLGHIGGWSWDRNQFADKARRDEVEAHIRARLLDYGFDAADVPVNPLPIS